MSNVLVIPDSHLKIDVIKDGLDIAKEIKADKVVILGDYFDDWHSIDYDYSKMIAFLKDTLRHNCSVIPLLGNHELSYLGYPCSGHNPRLKEMIDKALRFDYRFWTCVAIDGVLYSHAGVTSSWLRQNKILTENEMRYRLGKKAGAEVIESRVGDIEFSRTKWDVFAQAGAARGGREGQTPSLLWADLTELIADPIPNVKQVVGHTPVSEIQCVGNCWFTDVYSNYNISDEYLLVRHGKPEVIHRDEVLNGRK